MVKVTALSKEEVDGCPIRQVLSQVTGKWQMLVVLALEEEPLRFGALRREIGDVTQRVLTENLRKMERDGYLSRTVAAGPPVSVTYALTDLGDELLSHIKPMVFWAAERHPAIDKNRAAFAVENSNP